ncbi:MAG: 1-phosphofructokinase family hexose kinase [Chitinophagaceae bacterium]
MPSIVTITFSPCIDKSTAVSSLIPEKKLSCKPPKLEPGGGGINVARAIKKLGGNATAIFPSGGYTGKYFNHLMEEEEVPSIIIETANETRENIIVLDEASNNQYRFGMPGTGLSESEWKKCLSAVEQIDNAEFIIASGSLPPGVPTDIYGRLAKIAKAKNARYVVDTSGEALQAAAGEGVYLLKPNLGELSTLAGTGKIDVNKVEEIAKKVILEKKCAIIVVSLGAAGAALITSTETYKATPPKVHQKSTVGAGDSMVAGIVYGLGLGMNLEQSLRYGVACGTAATMNPGTELCSKKDADFLYTLVTP